MSQTGQVFLAFALIIYGVTCVFRAVYIDPRDGIEWARVFWWPVDALWALYRAGKAAVKGEPL